MKLSDKQRVNVWDFLEGHKNPAPLSWAWFGAVKMERRPLAYEETHRLLKYHTHSLVKPSSYYHEPLPLPPEDLEPLPEKPVRFEEFLLSNIQFIEKTFHFQKEEKADTPSSVDQSPGTILSGRGRGKGVKRPKKQKGVIPVTMNQQMTMQSQQQQQQHQQQMQGNNQMHMQMSMQVNCDDFTNEAILTQDASDPQNQMNPNMQQFQSNQMQNQMQNPNQMMNQVPGMGGMVNAQGQQSGMGFVPPGGQMGPGGQQLSQQQQWPQGFNPMQQQQQQQQFYNQGMQPQSKFFRKITVLFGELIPWTREN